jgi:ATP-dependent RNA helicase DDX31/DBP7
MILESDDNFELNIDFGNKSVINQNKDNDVVINKELKKKLKDKNDTTEPNTTKKIRGGKDTYYKDKLKVSNIIEDEENNNVIKKTKESKLNEEIIPSEKKTTSFSFLNRETNIEPIINDENNNKKIIKKSFTLEEDPNQYHSTPKDLSQDVTLKRPREVDNAKVVSRIFSRVPFSKIPLKQKLIDLLEKKTIDGGMGLPTSTRVQSVTLPLLVEKRRNILVKSQTGSGKTLTYLIPVINDLMTVEPKVERNGGTRALIIAPTRELCVQITDVLAKLTQCCVNIVGGCITGGENRKSEKARLRKGIVVLVSTPGRLLDHLKATESFNLVKLRWIILDEADRLLDMGFEQPILEALSIIRGARLPGLKDRDEEIRKGHNLTQKWSQQTATLAKQCVEQDDLYHIMASATVTKSVKSLAVPVMGGAKFTYIDADTEIVSNVNTEKDLNLIGKKINNSNGVTSFLSQSEESNGIENENNNLEDDENLKSKKSRTSLEKGEQMDAPEQLQQYHMFVSCKWRLAALLSFLKAHSHQKVMVFFVTCDSVDYHALLLKETEWPLELDEALPEERRLNQDNNNNIRKQAGIKEEHYIEPLASKFTGMMGKNCNLYRLHGNVPQKVRQNVYKEFCAAESGIMLCTDVAARGLDLPKVDWILQYDPPCETTDYLHRIGRTARKGLGGSALLFLLPSEAQYVQLLYSHNLYPEALSLQSLFFDAAKLIPGSFKFKNKDEMAAVILQRRIETIVHGNKHLIAAGRQAFRSFVRAYATHSADTKGVFRVQLLHLGHVAKSFGLRENPQGLTIKGGDDVIGKIFNGEFSSTVALDKETKQKARDEKYSLSKKSKIEVKKKNPDGTDVKLPGNKYRTNPAILPTKVSINDDKDDNGNYNVDIDPNSKPIPRLPIEKQRLRKMGKTSSLGGKLSASGKFRKSTTGYFRKKLRSQAMSEFSH